MNHYADIAEQKGQSVALYTASGKEKFVEIVSANGAISRYIVEGKAAARKLAKAENAIAWNF